MKSRKRGSAPGFTLIEVIITIVVVAILAAMMTAYFGTGITQSSVPIFRLGAAGKLNRILEKITVEYDKIPRWSPDTAYTNVSPFSIVIPTPSRRQEPFGYQYKCTGITGSGKSAATAAAEPGWPIPGTPGCTNDPPNYAGCTVTDNGVTWHLYAVAPLLRDLQDKIGVTEGQDYTATFGGDSISYRVIQNRFIRFDPTSKLEVNINSNIADPEYGRYLKVTIGLPMAESNRTDETLTTLFVKR